MIIQTQPVFFSSTGQSLTGYTRKHTVKLPGTTAPSRPLRLPNINPVTNPESAFRELFSTVWRYPEDKDNRTALYDYAKQIEPDNLNGHQRGMLRLLLDRLENDAYRDSLPAPPVEVIDLSNEKPKDSKPKISPPMGRKAYEIALKRQGIDIGVDRLLRYLDREMVLLERVISDEAKKLDPRKPWREIYRSLGNHAIPEHRLIAHYREMSRRNRKFLERRQLVTLPERDVIVKKMPLILRKR